MGSGNLSGKEAELILGSPEELDIDDDGEKHRDRDEDI